MKTKIPAFIGFAIGMVGFLTFFKVFILVNIPPEDEIAPGLVLLTSIVIGLVFAYVGSIIGRKWSKSNT
jgi:hypothetical protein